MIRIRELSKSYGDVVAVDRLTLEVRRGELFGFIGANGAGKTTTIKVMMGLIHPDQGTINIVGFDVVKEAIQVRQITGYVPEEPVLYRYLTGTEFLDFVAELKGLRDEHKRDRVEEWLDFFNLMDKRNDLISTYSYGMTKKIAIAAALIGNPKVLLLDEPTMGLDPESTYKFKKRLKKMCRQGVTAFFSSHLLDTVEKLCDRIGIIQSGKLVAVGTMAELRKQIGESLTLEEVFMRLSAHSNR